MTKDIKIVTWNLEWMTHFFVNDTVKIWNGRGKRPGIGTKPKDVDEVARRIAGVLSLVKGDIIGLQEGPPKKNQLVAFVRKYLGNEYEVFHSKPTNKSQRQSCCALVRKGIGLKVRQVAQSNARFKDLIQSDEFHKWTDTAKVHARKVPRLPLALELSLANSNEKVELLICHAKSLYGKLRSRSQWANRDREAIVDALFARQRLAAELYKIRKYVNDAVINRKVNGCIVIGDFNEGIGRDVFEREFLIHNAIDELRGGFDVEAALLHHALAQKWLDPARDHAYSVEFMDATEDSPIVRRLLDHILVTTNVKDGVSRPIRLIKNSGRIEHMAFEAMLTKKGRSREHRPSDHRPVSAKFKVVEN